MEKWKLPRSSQSRLIEVDPVVERDGTHRRGDAQAGAGRIAKHERVEVLRLDPYVAAVDEEARFPDVAERNAQLGARVDEDVSAANGDFVDGERIGGVGRLDLSGDVLGHERVLQEAAERIDAAHEK
jgi:hypothetical protein